MTSYQIGPELGNELLTALSKSQAAVVDVVGRLAGTVRSISPELPQVSLPFASRLPPPQDVLTGAYDFAEKLLAGQRKFAEDLLTATAG